MDWHPFNKDEAFDICEDFEDLIGTKFTGEDYVILKVDNVVVGPYYEDDIKAFVARYLESKDAAAAMTSYIGGDFDVLVLTYEADDSQKFHCMTIRLFVETRGISYKFPAFR